MTRRKTKKPRPWDRKLWGVIALPLWPADLPMILASTWDRRLHAPNYEVDESSRVLRFDTKKAAVAFIKAYTVACVKDRLRVVRIRERVEVLP